MSEPRRRRRVQNIEPEQEISVQSNAEEEVCGAENAYPNEEAGQNAAEHTPDGNRAVEQECAAVSEPAQEPQAASHRKTAERSNLVHCPDCGEMISRRAPSCPRCGCPMQEEQEQRTPGKPLKKQGSMPLILTAAALVLVLAIAGILLYLLVIKPNQMLTKAENLIDRSKYAEADIVLAELPDSGRKDALVARIIQHEAEEALDAGNFALAEKKLAQLPEG